MPKGTCSSFFERICGLNTGTEEPLCKIFNSEIEQLRDVRLPGQTKSFNIGFRSVSLYTPGSGVTPTNLLQENLLDPSTAEREHAFFSSYFHYCCYS